MLQARPGQMAIPALLALQVLRARLEPQVRMDPLESLALPVLRALPEQQVQMDPLELLALQVLREPLDPLALPAQRVLLEQPERLDPTVQQVRRGQLDLTALQEPQAQRVLQARLELREPLETLASAVGLLTLPT